MAMAVVPSAHIFINISITRAFLDLDRDAWVDADTWVAYIASRHCAHKHKQYQIFDISQHFLSLLYLVVLPTR